MNKPSLNRLSADSVFWTPTLSARCRPRERLNRLSADSVFWTRYRRPHRVHPADVSIAFRLIRSFGPANDVRLIIENWVSIAFRLIRSFGPFIVLESNEGMEDVSIAFRLIRSFGLGAVGS